MVDVVFCDVSDRWNTRLYGSSPTRAVGVADVAVWSPPLAVLKSPRVNSQNSTRRPFSSKTPNHTMSNRTTFVAILFLVAGMTHAFAPMINKRPSTTSLRFGFLKELGLEKPSWLPDFGDKKEEAEAAPAPAAAEAEDTEESEAPAEE